MKPLAQDILCGSVDSREGFGAPWPLEWEVSPFLGHPHSPNSAVPTYMCLTSCNLKNVYLLTLENLKPVRFRGKNYYPRDLWRS